MALLAGAPGSRQIVLSTMGGGVWQRSSDGHWRDISGTLPYHHAMPLARGANGTLYAGTMGYGVYMQQSTGSWIRLGHELSGGEYTSLSLAVAGGAHPALLTGTLPGVFRIPLNR
ncbi:MAG TPA: hypothetical protein VHB98_01265 [Chloroflexota bacterium]|nr:hypothetical protein [Chloroflexota bacterium]